MPYNSSVARLLLKTVILDTLLSAEAYGVPLPVILKATRQLGQVMLGTAGSAVPNSGLSWSLIFQFGFDTRNLHLWVLSASSTEEFIIRFVQYISLENVGLSFGHIGCGAGAIGLGGFRNLVAQELKTSIVYNATHVKKAIGIENNIIAILAYCGTQGKTKCRAILEVIKKLRGGDSILTPVIPVITPIISKPTSSIHPFRVECNAKSKIIIDNMFQEHTTRRCLQGSAQKIKTMAPTYLAPIASTQINTTALIGWTVLGLTFVGGSVFIALYFFQNSQRNKYYASLNQNETISDVTTEDF